MLNEVDLKKKNVAELKKIAKTKNIKIEPKLKKDEIIKLILMSEKNDEIAGQKKDEISVKNSSMINAVSDKKENSKDNLNNGYRLPDSYNKDKLVFMVRDPKWGFVYWEITESKIQQHGLSAVEKYLRCYDITESGSPENAGSIFDIRINDLTNNWYINFPDSNRTYIIDYGYFKDGKFVTVIRSNAATLPRDAISDQVDLEWMLPDDMYQYLLKASGAGQLFQQIGSQELMKFLAGNVNENLSSGSTSSVSSPFGASFNK
jgi:uncharacterized protein